MILMHEFVGNTLVPSEVIDTDICVAEAYRNLRIAYQPAEMRAEHSSDKPFAIVDELGQFVVKELSVEEAKNTNFVLKWLYDNDNERHDEKDLYHKFLKTQQDIADKRKAADRERLLERTEIAHSIASSPLHSYKINGKKIGSDNEMPYLGLWEDK
jgi:hypothetical protein